MERYNTHTVRSQNSWIWKCDIRKFFDTVDQEVLLKILSRRIKDTTILNLLKEIIYSFSIGMPIGNLTSQIFANIYLNELDRFIKHELKIKAYVRYGDDFVIFEKDLSRLKFIRNEVVQFLKIGLKLEINPKSDKILKASHGLKFLGVKIWPNNRTLNKRNLKRIKQRLNFKNTSSYYGLILKHGNSKEMKWLNWLLYELPSYDDFCMSSYTSFLMSSKMNSV